MPLIGVLTGGVDFSDRAIVLRPATVDAAGAEVPAVLLQYGLLIQSMLYFVIVAFAIFLVVKAINRMKRKEEAAPEPATPSAEVVLLTEIRDALKR
jgi:large conductance mechanosensitive channel